MDPKAAVAIQNFFADEVRTVQKALAENKVVVVGMAQNPCVKKARSVLSAQNIDFKYLEFGGYLSQWKPRLAIKLWSGWPTFPQVFVSGRLIGGFNELKQLLEQGKL